ncbi:unnamed protein product, partial [Arctia plantaginis]
MECEEAQVVAPEGERNATSSSSDNKSSPSSSEDEEGFASPRPNKRPK